MRACVFMSVRGGRGGVVCGEERGVVDSLQVREGFEGQTCVRSKKKV